MIFARSINGLSHCEQEYSTPKIWKREPMCCCARLCAWLISRASAPVTTSEGNGRQHRRRTVPQPLSQCAGRGRFVYGT